MGYLRTIHQVQIEMTRDTRFEIAQYIFTKSNINDTSLMIQKIISAYLCHPRCAARYEHARLTVVADIIAVTLGFPAKTPSSIYIPYIEFKVLGKYRDNYDIPVATPNWKNASTTRLQLLATSGRRQRKWKDEETRWRCPSTIDKRVVQQIWCLSTIERAYYQRFWRSWDSILLVWRLQC